MGAWASASKVFQGGTRQLLALLGKRVRAKKSMFGVNVYEDEKRLAEWKAEIPVGSIGFIGYPRDTCVLIAYTTDPKKLPSSFEAIMRLPRDEFFVAMIDWAPFKENFDVET